MAEQAEEKKAEAAEEAAAPEAPKEKSALIGKLVNGAGIFVLSLGAVVAGGFINSMLHPAPTHDYVLDPKTNMMKVYVPPEPKKKPEKKEKKKEKKVEKKPLAPALFYKLDPPLVVNFQESSNVRFLQIGMDIMARDPEVIANVEKCVPIIRNNLLLLISNRDYAKLMTREGKEELRAESLAEVKKILKKEAGDGAGVENLLFTSFVVQ